MFTAQAREILEHNQFTPSVPVPNDNPKAGQINLVFTGEDYVVETMELTRWGGGGQVEI